MNVTRISVRRRQVLSVLLAVIGGVCELAGASLANSQSQQNKTPVPQQPAAQQPTAQPASVRATVWVNIASGYYHRPDSRHYGKTKRGKYMLEADAIRAGFQPARN